MFVSQFYANSDCGNICTPWMMDIFSNNVHLLTISHFRNRQQGIKTNSIQFSYIYNPFHILIPNMGSGYTHICAWPACVSVSCYSAVQPMHKCLSWGHLLCVRVHVLCNCVLKRRAKLPDQRCAVFVLLLFRCLTCILMHIAGLNHIFTGLKFILVSWSLSLTWTGKNGACCVLFYCHS